MKFRTILAVAAKYAPFVSLFFIHIISLCQDMTKITDEIERGALIWTDMLILSAVIGEIGSVLVLDRFSQLMTGKTLNIVDDFRGQDIKEFSVLYNGVIVNSVLLTVLGVFAALYIITEIQLFLNCCTIFSVIFVLGTLATIFASYLRAKQETRDSILSKLLDPVALPAIILMIQVLVTNKKTVGFVYKNLYERQNTLLMILVLFVILCYVLAMAFCHFSNIYCLVAFAFKKSDLRQIEEKIDSICEENAKEEENLGRVTEYINEMIEQVDFLKSSSLMVDFLYAHAKVYYLKRYYAILYLFSFCRLRLAKKLDGLLEAEEIRNNGLRFCAITAVIELLLLDMLLFIYLGSGDPCSRFFELLSTVIIIPILLSALASLKKAE